MKHIAELVNPDPMKYNTYTEGQCTYYVFQQVKKQGKMIERSWRDAKYWAEHAKADGYKVNAIPAAGSILQSPRGQQGHVAFIEKVNSNGSILVSEMNYIAPYKVSRRLIDAAATKRYIFIHPKENKQQTA